MSPSARVFTLGRPGREPSSRLEVLALICVASALAYGVWAGLGSSAGARGPAISLDPAALPRYAAYSTARMAAAYVLSLLFSLTYGTLAARAGKAGAPLLAILDVLQSVPILSFLPVTLLGLTSVLPQGVAVELASIILIFTSQAWNITFAWHQSLTTIPKELREAGAIYRFNGWMRFRTIELPFAMVSLLWNSIMSWAGGWFFLMAAEIFTVGSRDFRLPGLGSYLQEAAARADYSAILRGVLTLTLVIIALDQFVWRPLLAWGERFKLTMTSGDEEQTSWFHDVLSSSRLVGFVQGGLEALSDRLDVFVSRRFPSSPPSDDAPTGSPWPGRLAGLAVACATAYGAWIGGEMLLEVEAGQWGDIAVGVGATFLRVMAAMAIALAWTLPLGVLIGSNPRAARILQPLAQIAASMPATALFPVFLMFLVDLTHGLNVAAVLLMLMGTQWYLLFNIIAGASSIPRDLKDTSTLLGLSSWLRWRTLILPSLFPYIVTGAITAGGGAWNASIVSEYVSFGGRTLSATGVGAIIARATAEGDYPLLLASTLSLILAVVLLNRLVWRRLYRLAEDKYRME